MTTKIKLSSNVSDVDLTTTAPTNGQGLIYNSTSSKWVPGAAGGGVTVYATIDDLPLSGVSTGALALVDSTNKLYLWMDTGWYNIATANIDPSITAGNNTPYLLALDGTPTVVTLTASDPEGIPLTWSYEVTSGSLTNGGGTTATVLNDGAGQFTVTPTTTEAYAGEFSLTFKASDGVNLGTTVAVFTLAFRVLDSKYTSLLVKALASGANSTFVDSSTNNFTITKNGDVTQGTFSPFSQPDGAWSNYFDGTGDYLSSPSSAANQFGAGDFTFEAWVFPTSVSAGQLFFRRTTVSAIGMIIQLTSGNVNLVAGDTNTSGWEVNLTSTSAVAANTWSHIAVTRSGSTWTIFINGTSAGIATASFTIAEETGSIKIGDSYSGHISNWRVVKGIALYTTNFTPPTAPLTAITGTSLLTCQSNRFKDNSTNAFAITVAGNTAVSPFGPFDRLAYNPAVHGGGAYFDGSGDYLSVAGGAAMGLGAGDFTVECFYYPKSLSATSASSPSLFDFRQAGGGGSSMLIYCPINTTNVVVYVGSSALLTATSAFSLGAWAHIAVARSSGVTSLYVDGVLKASASDSVDYVSGGTDRPYIGANAAFPGTGEITGHISNVRIVKGTAVYTSAFTPPTAPLTAVTNTSLLLNCVNANIIDNDSKNNLKLVGNTAASATQTKYAARSVYFVGDGTDTVDIANTDILSNITAADFTVEFWVNITANRTYNFVLSKGSGGTAREWAISVGPTAIIFVWYTNGSSELVYSVTPASIPTGVWMHVAVVKSGTSLFIFKDGIQIGTTGTFSAAAFTTTYPTRLGTFMDYTGISHSLNGYIEDLRITKGLARYTANFTPPTSELLG